LPLNNFIPSVWSARLLINLYKNLVYAQTGVINRDYEGEIAGAGDSVRITAIGAVTVGDYTKNSNIGDPETLNDAQVMLLVDQNKYFNFQIDDVDKAQQKPKVMDAAMREAGYALRDTADQYVAALMVAQVASANQIGTSGSPKTDLATTGYPYQYLVDLGVLLDDAKVPMEGRWVIVPPWFHGYLQKDQRFVSFGTPANDARLRNGVIGEAAGFTILKSQNVQVASAATSYKITAGYPGAVTFADQIASIEAYRPQQRFADAVKGLHVYGAKVIRPTGIAILHANPT
jgi:hypothetical protein